MQLELARGRSILVGLRPQNRGGEPTKIGTKSERGASLTSPLCQLRQANFTRSLISPREGAWKKNRRGSWTGRVARLGRSKNIFPKMAQNFAKFSQNFTQNRLLYFRVLTPPKASKRSLPSFLSTSESSACNSSLLREDPFLSVCWDPKIVGENPPKFGPNLRRPPL